MMPSYKINHLFPTDPLLTGCFDAQRKTHPIKAKSPGFFVSGAG